MRRIKHIMPLIIFFLFLLSPVVSYASPPIEKIVKDAEAALLKTDYPKVNELIKKGLKESPDSLDLRRVILNLDIATMQIGKMLYDYDDYTRRLGSEDYYILKFAIISILQKAVAHENYYVRSAAVKAVGDMGTPDLIPMIQPLLDDEVSFVRSFTVETLGVIGTDDVILPLGRLFEKEKDLAVKIEIVKILVQIGSEKAVRFLTEHSEDKDTGSRMLILGYLGSIGKEPNAASQFAMQFEDKDPLSRAVSVYAMSKMKGQNILKYLKKASEDTSPEVRTYAALGLSEVKEKERLAILMTMTKDKDITVRSTAYKSINQYPDIPPKIFEDTLNDKEPFVKMEGIRYFRSKKAMNDKIKDAVNMLLDDKDYEVRHSVLGVLGMAGDKDDVIWLEKGLNDPVDRVRIAAIRGLGRIKGEKAFELLKKSLNDKNSTVLVYAAGNLGNIIYNAKPRLIKGRE